jgi:hypothetical protein
VQLTEPKPLKEKSKVQANKKPKKNAEIPSVELARLDDKDVSSERFRYLLDYALHEGRIVDLARSMSCSAAQIRLSQISIVLMIVRGVLKGAEAT